MNPPEIVSGNNTRTREWPWQVGFARTGQKKTDFLFLFIFTLVARILSIGNEAGCDLERYL